MLNIYTNSIFYRHDTGVGHPETASRIDAALEGVRAPVSPATCCATRTCTRRRCA